MAFCQATGSHNHLALSKGCCSPLEVMTTYPLDHSRYFSIPPYPVLSASHPKWM